jgi:hypothetical protein
MILFSRVKTVRECYARARTVFLIEFYVFIAFIIDYRLSFALIDFFVIGLILLTLKLAICLSCYSFFSRPKTEFGFLGAIFLCDLFVIGPSL